MPEVHSKNGTHFSSCISQIIFVEGGLFSDEVLHLKVGSPSRRVLEVLPPHIKVRVEDKIGRKCRGNAVDLSWLLTAHENPGSACLPFSPSIRDLPSNCHGSMAARPPSFPGAFSFPPDEQGQLFYDYEGASSLCK